MSTKVGYYSIRLQTVTKQNIRVPLSSVSPELKNKGRAVSSCNAFTRIYINPQMAAKFKIYEKLISIYFLRQTIKISCSFNRQE